MPVATAKRNPASGARASLSVSMSIPAVSTPAVHKATLSECGHKPIAYSIEKPPSAKAAAANQGIARSAEYRLAYRNTITVVARYANVLNATRPRQPNHEKATATHA